MAELSVTPGSVLAAEGAVTEDGTFGATVTAGQAVYRDAADNKYKLADSNSATAAARVLYGVSLNGGSSGQPGRVIRGGNFNPGGTVIVGSIYILGATAGSIAVAAPGTTDLVTGMYTALLGIGTTTSNIAMQIQNGGVAVP